MIIRIKPDKEKAAALKKMAEITLERLNNTDIEKYPSNTLTDFYDIIHKLLEAVTLSMGIKIKGEGAHQDLIEYVARQRMIDEQTRQLMQQMREYRNNIAYEGFTIHKNYIKLNREKIEQTIKLLLKQ